MSEEERERLRESLTTPPADVVPDTLTVSEVRGEFEAILAQAKDEPEIEYEVLRDALDIMSRLDAAMPFYQKGQ